MIKRFIYWITNKHFCKGCCLFCKFYKKCRKNEEYDMRKIIFRGKRTDNGEWVEWTLLGALFANPNIEVDLETIGQYTGLIDRNGKRIFEGDIVRDKMRFCLKGEEYNAHNYPVIFSNGEFCLGGIQDRSLYPMYLEVIGNIHDNPDLLKEDLLKEREG